MDNFSGMQVFECLSELVNNIFNVNIFEDSLPDDIMQVSLHKLKH